MFVKNWHDLYDYFYVFVILVIDESCVSIFYASWCGFNFDSFVLVELYASRYNAHWGLVKSYALITVNTW